MVWATPGVGSTVSQTPSEILWGADHARNAVLWQSAKLSSTLRDDANSPTTLARPGLLLGKLDSGGEYEEWDADVATGTQNIAGVLDTEMDMLDRYATAEDKVYRIIVGRAPLKVRKLLIQGSAFLTHADEYLARRQLHAAGHILDDDPMGYKAGAGGRMATVTGTTDTLTADENGTTLFYSNAASVTVTLPAIKPGLEFTLVRTADEEFIVTSTAGDDIICGGDASSDSVTWTTGSQQIGAGIVIKAFYVSTTLKWLPSVVAVPYSTGAFLASSFAS